MATNKKYYKKKNIQRPKKETTNFDVTISTLDKNTTLVTSAYNYYDDRVRTAISEYSPDNKKYSVYLNEGQAPSDSITLSEVSTWSTSPQTSLSKIQQINAYIRKLVNMNDIVGKVVESITTNINTEYKLTFSHEENDKKKKKSFSEAKRLIHEVNDSINIKKIIRNAPTTAYTEGNWICYLRHEDTNNYCIDIYPIGVAEISEYLINSEPVVQFNVQQLRSRLRKTYKKNKKNKALFFEKIDDEIKNNYPSEVYEGFKNNESYVNLDYRYTGVIRINNQDRNYGVSPILRAIPDLLMIDQFRTTDDVNAKARGKKIIHQKMRKELITGSNVRKDTYPEQAYAHQCLADAWKNQIVLATTPPTVESIEYIEPTVEMVPVDTYNYYRSKVLATLGISFLMDSGSQSVSTASISVTQLMRTINSITEQLENILFRFYRQILIDNGFDTSYTPHISIIDSEMLEMDIKQSLASFYYNVLGTSRQTAFETVGLDPYDEYQKRKSEQDAGFDKVLVPYGNSYTKSSEDTLNNNDNDKGGRPKGKDTGKSGYDSVRNKALKK